MATTAPRPTEAWMPDAAPVKAGVAVGAEVATGAVALAGYEMLPVPDAIGATGTTGAEVVGATVTVE